MALWQTSAKISKIKIDKLAKQLENIESPLDDSWDSIISDGKQGKGIEDNRYDHALGTIGGGNHFAEFQAIEEVLDQQSLEVLGLDKKQLQLLVHSGSRGLGQSILMEHITEYSHNGIRVGSEGFQHYMTRHNTAVCWAALNRELIAKRFIAAIKADGRCALDVTHNAVTPTVIDNTTGWVHRKGATPSDQGYVIIPGSRGDYSYLVKPTTDVPTSEDGHIASLFSLAHGAGRKWKRGDCHGRLSHKYKREDLYKTALGSRVICGNKELLYDEAPQAYKKCETIIEDLLDAGLITLVAKLRPVLTFKTHGGNLS
ncbi:RNA ligase RtcB family protein [Photobacterium aquae]|uniref:RNA ligase RtcB family protein n=1 Tax=Photobacterium aquae TaxID=1195763 RepID=UPI000A84D62E|nr:RNA ligase RtcB family protein [Photobacterium aquae]